MPVFLTVSSMVTIFYLPAYAQTLPFNAESVTLLPDSSSSKKIIQRKRLKKMMTDSLYLSVAAARSFFNPSLTIPFLRGQIHPHIPHAYSKNILGHTKFRPEETDKFTKMANQTPNGVITYWAGPFPFFYVANNEARKHFIQEEHIGSIDAYSEDYLRWLTGGNDVMSTFPVFRSINSDAYQRQRRFLMMQFHQGTKKWLPTITEATSEFLGQYCESHGSTYRPLRDVLKALVLRSSSHVLDLTKVPLDCHYFEDEVYKEAIDRIAHYGITERADKKLEETLYHYFAKTFRQNFDQIQYLGSGQNLILNIFESLDIPFPSSVEEFETLPQEIRHTVAMNFYSTGVGALAHSTANTLDWAVATLLKNPAKLNQLQELMEQHKTLDLTQEGLFDNNEEGPLFPIAEWVLHNIFLYPPFSHEFFLNSRSFETQLPDGTKVTVPKMSFTVVNYQACNRSELGLSTPESFCQSLAPRATIGKFVMDKRNASFGGSEITKKNAHSRKCPGAKFSLHEQMIIIATLLRDYDLQVDPSEDISCDGDPKMHPICSRMNVGNVILKKKNLH